jgi:uncharacterized protein YaaW (UPF0174 family)
MKRTRYCDGLKKVPINRPFLEKFFGPTLSRMEPAEGRKLVNSILQKLTAEKECVPCPKT